jgi:hypothetical protein
MPKLQMLTANDGARYASFFCPGCDEYHGPIVEKGTRPVPVWEWNGSLNTPTFSPSIRVQGTVPLTEDEYQRVRRGEHVEPKPRLCHSFVRDGRIEFLSDCTHALAGQTVDLPEVEP